MKRRMVLIGASVLMLSAAAIGAPHAFTFSPLEGFLNLKGVDRPPPMSPIEADYFEEAKGYDEFAVQLQDGEVVAVYAVKVTEGVAPLTNMRENLANTLTSSPDLKDTRVVSLHPERVSGVEVGRIELESGAGLDARRHLTFIVPGREHWAMVKISATPSAYPETVRKLEAVIPKIGGLMPPGLEVRQKAMKEAEASNPGFGIGGAIGLGALLGMFLKRLLGGPKRKRSA